MVEKKGTANEGWFPVAKKKAWAGTAVAALILAAVAVSSNAARADENGISFWLPGLFGSLAAAPQQPGWSFATINYYDSVSAGSSVADARDLSINGVPANFTGKISGSVRANIDVGLMSATYVFATPILGGQASVSLMGFPGYNHTSLSGKLKGVLTLPGGAIPISQTFNLSDSTGGFGDLYPQASLRWNAGVNNFMTYVTGDVPIGTYNAANLANLGIGHGTIDSGVGYTYFNPQTSYEFSAVAGLTYNFLNPDTHYQSGVDFHLDWAASKFLTKQTLVGVVGYVYREIGCDSGSGDRVGCFQSQVFGVGPQIGYLFPAGGGMQGYLNLKGYGEFGAVNRPDGFNIWLTFSLSPAAPPAPVMAKG